jgi:geranylgeranyl pyrophosphate synthase
MAKAREYISQAKQHLQGFTDSQALTTLFTLADYVISRDV